MRGFRLPHHHAQETPSGSSGIETERWENTRKIPSEKANIVTQISNMTDPMKTVVRLDLRIKA
jgi:hypothetical protein